MSLLFPVEEKKQKKPPIDRQGGEGRCIERLCSVAPFTEAYSDFPNIGKMFRIAASLPCDELMMRKYAALAKVISGLPLEFLPQVHALA